MVHGATPDVPVHLSYEERQRIPGERNDTKAEGCVGCLLKCQSTKAMGNRWINPRKQLKTWRQNTCQNLTSEETNKLRSLRGVEVESVFGRLKVDWASADSS